MHKERIFWILLSCILGFTSLFLFRDYSVMKTTLLVGKHEKKIVNIAVAMFQQEEGIPTRSEIDRMFYISYADFSRQDCIRFVPRKLPDLGLLRFLPGGYTTGGSTSYCFTNEKPIRLLSVDRGAE